MRQNLKFMLAILFCLSSSNLFGQTTEKEFPYLARVTQNTTARSGPASVHYPTEKVRAGTQVQVFRHDPDGWCAIRPLANSFSLISEDQVRISNSGRWGKILLDDAKVWVGTTIQRGAQPLCQVQLAKEEIVGIQDRLVVANSRGERIRTYQITPPTGEFRWIHSSAIQKKSGDPAKAMELLKNVFVDDDLLAKRTAETNRQRAKIEQARQERMESNQYLVTNRRSSTSSANPKPKPFSPSPIQQDRVTSKQIQLTSHQLRSKSSNSNGRSVEPKKLAVTSSGWVRRTGSPAEVSADPIGMRSSDNGMEIEPSEGPLDHQIVTHYTDVASDGEMSESFQSRLTELELELSNEMVKLISQQNTSELMQKCDRLRQQARSQSESNSVQNLQSKIESFARIVQKRKSISGKVALASFDREDNGPNRLNNNSRAERSINELAIQDSDESPFEGTGVLNKLYRNSGKSPHGYVLQDSAGKPMCIVVAAAGFNLERYLKKRVGLIGKRGYHNQYKMPLIQVDRVVLLSETK